MATSVHVIVVIPGFGERHYEEKKCILRNNMEILMKSSSLCFHFHLLVRLYSLEHREDFTSFLLELEEEYSGRLDIFSFHEAGFIGPFLREKMTPSFLSCLQRRCQRKECCETRVLFLLDDVVLVPLFCFDEFCFALDDAKLDCLSPSLHAETPVGHNFMKNMLLDMRSVRLRAPSLTYLVRRTNFVEFFCCLFTMTGWEKFHRMLLGDIIYMWGVDIAFYEETKSRIGISYLHEMLHMYGSSDQMAGHAQEELEKNKRRMKNNNFQFSTFQIHYR